MEKLCRSKRGIWALICRSYLIYIKCLWMTSSHFSGGHSCRGLWVRGLVLDHISAHQLRNGVQIAALIPGLGPAGGPSTPEQPIAVTSPTKRSSLIDSGVDSGPTAACAALYRYIPTLQHSVYLVGGPLGLSDMRTVGC